MNVPVTLANGSTVDAELVSYTGDRLAVYHCENPSWARRCGLPRFHWQIVHVDSGLGIARFVGKDDAEVVARQLYGRLPKEAWRETDPERLNDLIDRELGPELAWLQAE